MSEANRFASISGEAAIRVANLERKIGQARVMSFAKRGCDFDVFGGVWAINSGRPMLLGMLTPVCGIWRFGRHGDHGNAHPDASQVVVPPTSEIGSSAMSRRL